MDDGSSNRCFNGDMTKWREYNGTEYLCSSNYINGCSGSTATTASTTITTTTTTTTTSCETKYGTGWHYMDDGSSGRCFNSGMTEYKNSDSALYQCSTNYIAGCSTSGTTTTTTTTTTTQDECATKYGTGWHSMTVAPGYCFDSYMTQYRDTGGILQSCSTTYVSGCSSTSGGSGTTSSCTGTDQASCTSVTNCYWYSGTAGSSSYCYYSTTAPSASNTFGNKLFAALRYSLESLGETLIRLFSW